NQDLAHGAWAVGHPFHPRYQVGQVVIQVHCICCLRNPIGSHCFRSVELVEARFEGRFIEMMHQTVERLLRVPRRQPSYPGQLRGRCHLRLWWSHNVSPPRVILPRVLPSTGVTPLLRYYDPSDFLTVISAFLLCPLVCRYFPPWKNDEDLPRSPRCSGYMPCSLTPEVSSPHKGRFAEKQCSDFPPYGIVWGVKDPQPKGGKSCFARPVSTNGGQPSCSIWRI